MEKSEKQINSTLAPPFMMKTSRKNILRFVFTGEKITIHGLDVFFNLFLPGEQSDIYIILCPPVYKQGRKLLIKTAPTLLPCYHSGPTLSHI